MSVKWTAVHCMKPVHVARLLFVIRTSVTQPPNARVRVDPLIGFEVRVLFPVPLCGDFGQLVCSKFICHQFKFDDRAETKDSRRGVKWKSFELNYWENCAETAKVLKSLAGILCRANKYIVALHWEGLIRRWIQVREMNSFENLSWRIATLEDVGKSGHTWCFSWPARK